MNNRCDACEASMINGVYCHETGCPKAWVDSIKKCKWCGEKFTPETQFQATCDHSCAVSYVGESCDCSECEEDFGYLRVNT